MEANQTFAQLADDARLQKTIAALKDKGFEVEVAETAAEAKDLTLKLLPKGAEVFTLQSATLKTIGVVAAVDESGDYQSVRKQLEKLGREPSPEKRKLASAPEIAIGSVHAITEDGTLMIASNTGSQLAADASGAGQVIFVVGTQKLVKDLDEGFKRIDQYSLPLEDVRIGQLYPGLHTAVNKLLIIKKDGTPGRIRIILVKQNLGF